MVVIIGFEGSANKIGIGIIQDGKVKGLEYTKLPLLFCMNGLTIIIGQLWYV